MISIQDSNSPKLPVIFDGDYASFFQREEMLFLASSSWKKVCCNFGREMKLSVSPCDIEELKNFLRNKREQILKDFQGHDYYMLWNKCFDLNTNSFNKIKFVKTLVTLYDEGIDRIELDSFLAWYCLTKQIDRYLSLILEQEKNKRSSVINFYYNDIGEIRFANETGYNEKVDDICDEEPLRNYIFQERIFDSNERLIMLRSIIASAIDMGDATPLYGQPQEMRINPNAQNEWYYIVKAIEESGVTKKFTITHFIEQMIEWFPILFPSSSKEEWEKFKRRLSKSISEEKRLWKHGKMKNVIPLKDMWAKRNQIAMDSAKLERVYAIVYKGLYQNLVDLKDKIAKEKSR